MGRVLVPFDFQRVYSEIEKRTGLGGEQIAERICPTGLIEQFECGKIEAAEFVTQITKVLDLDCTFDEFREMWCSIFLPYPLVPEDLLRRIAARYRMVLLSNTNVLHYGLLRETRPLLRHFHAYVLSNEVGAMKPSPLIYEKAIEAAGCRAEECFFTDDIPEFVEGARRCGIDAVLFETPEKLEKELRTRIELD